MLTYCGNDKLLLCYDLDESPHINNNSVLQEMRTEKMRAHVRAVRKIWRTVSVNTEIVLILFYNLRMFPSYCHWLSHFMTFRCLHTNNQLCNNFVLRKMRTEKMRAHVRAVRKIWRTVSVDTEVLLILCYICGSIQTSSYVRIFCCR